MIKASKILKTVEKLGKKHPKRSRDCVYFTDAGKPCCIVGHALFKLGVDVEPFLRNADLNGFTKVDGLLSNYASLLGIKDDLSYIQVLKLRAIQDAQDVGHPWGRAVKSRPCTP